MSKDNIIEMDCEVVQDLLPLYHDEVVNEETRQSIEKHLKICPECQKEYDSICLEFLSDVFQETYPENRFELMMQKQKKKKKIYRILFFSILAAAIVSWGIHKYNQIYTGSSSMAFYMLEDLYENGIERYTGKILVEQTFDGKKLELLEDVAVTFEKGKLRPWNDTMPETDSKGTPLSRKRCMAVLDCRIEITRYILVDGEKVPDSETTKTISYNGYDDRDLDSVARAVIDFDSEEISYSDTKEYFEDLDAQIENVL